MFRLLKTEGRARRGEFSCTHGGVVQIVKDNTVVSYIYDAFEGCHLLEQIEIGANVNKIDSGAFAYCENLTSILVASENATYYSNKNCILERDTLRLVLCSNACIVPNETRIIGTGSVSETFTASLCKELIIPDGVCELEQNAICSTVMEAVYIPKSVSKIDAHAVVLSQGTVYCEADVKPEGWDMGWLSTGKTDNVEVIWGYDFTQIQN